MNPDNDFLSLPGLKFTILNTFVLRNNLFSIFLPFQFTNTPMHYVVKIFIYAINDSKNFQPVKHFKK